MPEKVKKELARIMFVLGSNHLGSSFVFVIYTVFLVSRGMSYVEVALLNVIYHVTIPLLEAPTGAFADLVGRKKSYMIAVWLEVLGFLCYFIAGSFWQFAVAEVILAVADAFVSGCTDAHVWETITTHAEAEEMEPSKILELNRQTTLAREVMIRVTGAGGGAIGAFISSYNMGLPWLVAAIALSISGILAIRYYPNDKGREDDSPRFSRLLMLKSIKKGFGRLIHSRTLMRLTIIEFLAGAAMLPVFMYWGPYFKNLGGANGFALLSGAWIFIEGFILFGAYLGKSASKKFRDGQIVLVATISLMCSLVVLAISHSILLSLIALFLVEAFNAASAQAQKIMAQREIGDITEREGDGQPSLRATTLSLISMISELGAILGLLLGGFASQYLSIPIAWGIGAVLLSASVIIQFVWTEGG